MKDILQKPRGRAGKTVQLNVEIREATRNKLKKFAKRHGMHMSTLVDNMIRKQLET